jgi:hypothetical protein
MLQGRYRGSAAALRFLYEARALASRIFIRRSFTTGPRSDSLSILRRLRAGRSGVRLQLRVALQRARLVGRCLAAQGRTQQWKGGGHTTASSPRRAGVVVRSRICLGRTRCRRVVLHRGFSVRRPALSDHEDTSPEERRFEACRPLRQMDRDDSHHPNLTSGRSFSNDPKQPFTLRSASSKYTPSAQPSRHRMARRPLFAMGLINRRAPRTERFPRFSAAIYPA